MLSSFYLFIFVVSEIPDLSICVLNVMSVSIILGQIDIDMCRPTSFRNRHNLFKRNTE